MKFDRIYKFYQSSLYCDRKNPTEKLSLEQVKLLPEYIGVLQSDIVLIDIDTKEQSGTLIKILNDTGIKTVIYKSFRGYHFLFSVPDEYEDYLKSYTKQNTALGLTVDYKLGKNNDCQRLKREGVEYELLSDEELSPLPYFLLPVSAPKNELWQMSEGESRNDTLLCYQWNLYKAGLTVDEIKALYTLINNYVFKDKLSTKEIETITRPEAIQKVVENSLMAGKSPDVKTISDLMIKNDSVIKVNGMLHIYTSSGMYSNNIDLIRKRILDYIPDLKTAPRTEVIHFLEINAPEMEYSDKRYVLFRNGIYDIETMQLLPLNKRYIIPNKINWCYNPNASDENVRDFLYSISCNDEQVIDLLEEMIGYCLFRANSFRKMFILTGTRRNGKSTFLNCIKYMLGEDNISAVGLESISKRFINTTLLNKLANLGDDIESTSITYTADLKKLVSGETILVERKGQDAIPMKSYAKLIFSANKIPRIQDDTGAVIDRMIIVPFNAYYDEFECDPFIIEKLTTQSAIETFIAHGIDGLNRLLTNKAFTIPDCVKYSLDNYLIETNPMRFFIQKNQNNIIGRVNNDVFDDYIKFCAENDISSNGVTVKSLTRAINKELGYKSDTNNKKRVFKYK